MSGREKAREAVSPGDAGLAQGQQKSTLRRVFEHPVLSGS